jgi:hypothetical protein
MKEVNAETLTKIINWLQQRESHGIYTDDVLRRDFNTATGEIAEWPSQGREETARMISDRGLGGSLGETKGRVCSGYVVAEHLAAKYADGYSSGRYSGRGTRFRAALGDLQLQLGKLTAPQEPARGEAVNG